MKTPYFDKIIDDLQNHIESVEVASYAGLKEERKELAEYEAIKRALSLFAVSDLLPENYCFDDENGNEVPVLLTIGDTCIVSSDNKEEPYTLPLEFVIAIYTDTLIEGNKH